MTLILLFIFGTIASWVILLIVVPIAQSIMKFGLPPWPETLGKLAIVAGVYNVTDKVFGEVNFFLGAVAGFIVLWILLYKWFDVDFLGMLVIVFVSFFIQLFLAGILSMLVNAIV